MAEHLRGLIVDDHPIVVNALATSLTSLGTLDTVDQERSLSGAIDRLASGEHYDLVILDLNLGETNGTDTLIRFREAHPDLPVVIFSADESEQTVLAAYEHGAHGYIPKSFGMPVIVNAIRTVLTGSVYVPPQLIASLGVKAPKLEAHEVGARLPLVSLSPRQAQVFEYLLQGMPNKVIGARLGMAEGTVKTHVNTIYRMFGVNNRAKMILRARELGLI